MTGINKMTTLRAVADLRREFALRGLDKKATRRIIFELSIHVTIAMAGMAIFMTSHNWAVRLLGVQFRLSVKIPASDRDRVDELSAKARAGSLTEAETQELHKYLHIGFLLGTMQAKARRLLPTESPVTPQ
jgi:hypothetical protein